MRISSVDWKERTLASLSLAAASRLSNDSGRWGSFSWNCFCATSGSSLPQEKVFSTSLHSSESAGRTREGGRHSSSVGGGLSSVAADKTAWRALEANGNTWEEGATYVAFLEFEAVIPVFRQPAVMASLTMKSCAL